MAVPKRRRTRGQRNQRRSHDALTHTALVTCTTCNSPTLPHTVCRTCGTYQGVQIRSVHRTEHRTKGRLARKADLKKERREAQQPKAEPKEKEEDKK